MSSDSAERNGGSPSQASGDVQTRTFLHCLPNLGPFIEQHTYKCFFVGTPSLIIGSLLYYTPMHNNLMNLFYISLMLIFIGGILIWIPVFHWMAMTNDQSDFQTVQPSSERFVPRMKPPDYDSVIPPGSSVVGEAPPAYDEIFQNAESNLVVHTNSNDAANTSVETSSTHQDQSVSGGTLHSHTQSSQSLTGSGSGSSRDVQEADTQPLLP